MLPDKFKEGKIELNTAQRSYDKPIQDRADFFDGFPSLDDYSDEIHISFLNRIKLFLITRYVFLYRFIGTLTGARNRMDEQILEELKSHRNHRLKARSGSESKQDLASAINGENSKLFYLTPTELATFESTGLLGPFDVITPEQAKQVADYSFQQHENGSFAETCIFDEETYDILRRTDQWRLDYSGLYQANLHRRLRDVLSRPEIAHRMASLLGENTVCWRSQFFEKRPGEIGTFWHQNSVFRETGKYAKLKAPEGIEPGMIQLTAWIALTDVTRENGALRMIPGSFTDSMVEFFYSFIQDNKLNYLSSIDKDKLVDYMKLMLFSTGTFCKAQAVFDSIYDRVENLFRGKHIVNLEMKAGQAIIFSSLNMHASFPNITTDNTRLAFAGRYCNNDIKVFDNMTHGILTTADGPRKYDVTKLGMLQVHGKDLFGHNNIVL